MDKEMYGVKQQQSSENHTHSGESSSSSGLRRAAVGGIGRGKTAFRSPMIINGIPSPVFHNETNERASQQQQQSHSAVPGGGYYDEFRMTDLSPPPPYEAAAGNNALAPNAFGFGLKDSRSFDRQRQGESGPRPLFGPTHLAVRPDRPPHPHGFGGGDHNRGHGFSYQGPRMSPQGAMGGRRMPYVPKADYGSPQAACHQHVAANPSVFTNRYKQQDVTRVPSSSVSYVTYHRIPALKETFAESADMLPPRLLSNLQRLNMTQPTPIQRFCVPIVTFGALDLCAAAETGSGKTACYWVSMLSLLSEDLAHDKVPLKDMPDNQCAPMGLVICPTRELAIQVAGDGAELARGLESGGQPLKVSCVIGGVSLDWTRQNSRNCVVVVGTPGRLRHMVEQKSVELSKVRYVVLDEADKLLDEAEQFSLDWLLLNPGSGLPPLDHRITQLFSATWTRDVQGIAKSYLRDQNVTVTIGTLNGANPDIEQHIVKVEHQSDKFNKLLELLGQIQTSSEKLCEPIKVLVFCERKKTTEQVVHLLNNYNIRACCINSGRDQAVRDQNLNEFRGDENVMVATHLAGRGLDIRHVQHVINYDLPATIGDYVHRIGRTGRIGNRGTATSFYASRPDARLANDLITIMSEVQQTAPSFLYDDARLDPTGPAAGGLRTVPSMDRMSACMERLDMNPDDEVSALLGTRGSSGTGGVAGSSHKPLAMSTTGLEEMFKRLPGRDQDDKSGGADDQDNWRN